MKKTTITPTNVELDRFEFTLKNAGFSAALTDLMSNNKKLATQINKISAGFKEQDPNGPSPLDALTEAINNLPRENNSCAFLIAASGDEVIGHIKGKEEHLMRVISETMDEQEPVKKILEISVITNHMFNSMTSRRDNPLSGLMGMRRNPLEDQMGGLRNPSEDLKDLMELMELMDKLPDSPERKPRGPFGGGFGF